jgi:hypothetical protein
MQHAACNTWHREVRIRAAGLFATADQKDSDDIKLYVFTPDGRLQDSQWSDH